MPVPEVAAQASNLVEIVGVVAAGAGSIVATGYAGFVRLGARFDAHAAHSQEAIERVEEAVKELNGHGRKNTTAIAKINTRCEERHKPAAGG